MCFKVKLIKMDGNNKFQELVRVLDATLFDLNKEKGLTGHVSLEIIKFLLNFNGIDNLISKEFKEYMFEQIKNKDSDENVRKEIKNILMYPENKYPPWNIIDVENSVLERINEKVQSIKFKIDIVDGKVFGIPDDIKQYPYTKNV